jgi:hypothetical protein
MASNKQKKEELMQQAKRAGWKGKSYRKAKKFERKLERESPKMIIKVNEYGIQQKQKCNKKS